MLWKRHGHTEREAERLIFESLLEAENTIPHRGHTLKDYVNDSGMRAPSKIVKVEYLKPCAFPRYAMRRAKAGCPIGQYKPPKIPPRKVGDL